VAFAERELARVGLATTPGPEARARDLALGVKLALVVTTIAKQQLAHPAYAVLVHPVKDKEPVRKLHPAFPFVAREDKTKR
jgi:hypothetical protein